MAEIRVGYTYADMVNGVLEMIVTPITGDREFEVVGLEEICDMYQYLGGPSSSMPSRRFGVCI